MRARARLFHRLVGYDRETERIAVEHDIPPEALEDAKKIAGVEGDDPLAIASYPLARQQARAIADLIRVHVDTFRNDYFLECFAAPRWPASKKVTAA